MELTRFVRPIYLNDILVATAIYIRAKNLPNIVELHNIVHHWNHLVLEQLLITWARDLKVLRKARIKKIIISAPILQNNKKFRQYCKLFGFHVEVITIEDQQYMYGEMEV